LKMRTKNVGNVVRDALDKIVRVFDAYMDIAEGFVFWRARPWPMARLGGRGIILDLGSGSCINGAYAYRFGGKYVLCLDVSFFMSILSRKTLIREGVRGDSIAGDMLFIPIRDNAVDSVIAIASLHHIPKEVLHLVVAEIKRISANGATVIATLWSWRQARFVLSTVLNIFLKSLNIVDSIREYKVPWRKRSGAIHRYYCLYTLKELLDLFRRHGFQLLSYGYFGYLKKKSNNIYIVARVVK